MNVNNLRWAASAILFSLMAACGGGGTPDSTESFKGESDGQAATGSAGNESSAADLIAAVSPAVYTGDYASEKVAVFSLLNAYRSQCGFGMLAQNSLLDQAAQNHAQYSKISQQGHIESSGVAGFTGVSPGDRVAATGYSWSSVGEILGIQVWGAGVAGNVTYDLVSVAQLSATANLKGLLSAPYHLAGAMSLNRDIGIGVNNTGDAIFSVKPLNINIATQSNKPQQRIASNAIITFPCNGTTRIEPVFASEDPDPFPDVNRNITPYGQPVYVMTAVGSTVTLDAVRSTITPRGGVALPTRLLTQSNDPNARLTSNQAFLVPTTRLADNATYDVVLNGTLSTLVTNTNPTGAWSRTFTFYTGTFRGE